MPVKLSFSKKLFWLFLLFSLIPSILIATLGYYIAKETTNLTETDLRPASEFARYTHEQFNKALIATIKQAQAGSQSGLGIVDYLLVVPHHGGEHFELSSLGRIKTTISFLALEWSKIPGGGQIDLDSLMVQHLTIIDDSASYVAVIIHGQEYKNLLRSAQEATASASSRRELRSSYTIFLAILLTVSIFMTGLVAWYFSRRISRGLARPVASLAAAANRIASGYFGARVETEATGEIQTLIEAFNLMSEQLQLTTARLAQTERVAAWRNVARRFAHELKNPLQPILVSLYRIEKLSENSNISLELKEPLRAASEEVQHLTNLAERFSKLARLPEPKMETIDLRELITTLTTLYADQLKEFSFDLLLPDKPVFVSIDTTYFREVIHNLLHNAIDASENGAKIVLSLSEVSKIVKMTVDDNGLGMSQETIASARLPYFTTKDSGNGLGLAIVEKIVTECGGSMQIQSQENIGTSVAILLPLADRNQTDR